MPDLQYIGVYSTSELPSALGAGGRVMVKRKRLWFVWEMVNGLYKVQPLNAILQPMAEPRLVPLREFEARFSFEDACIAAPLGFMHPSLLEEGKDGVPMGGGSGTIMQFSPVMPAAGGHLRPDDPNLLQAWLQSSPSSAAAPAGELTALQERELSRMVEDSLADISPEESQQAKPLNPDATLDLQQTAEEQGEPVPGDEQSLRADFAIALIKIKQGRREEGVVLLEALVSRTYQPFDGAPQFFSELGLNLRRLGLITLALAAHKKALTLSPRDERVHFNLARIYHDMNQFADAKKHLEQALALAPSFDMARQFLQFLEGK